MTTLIFGASGQDGYYLSELLKQEGHKVLDISRQGSIIKADVADYSVTRELIREHKPEYIFHMAANSTTKHEALFENHATIATGTLNILEAVKKFSSQSKVFISGSGLQFKNNGKPIKETDDFEARDPYSVSRIHSVYASRYYRKLGIRSYVGYFFNHDSLLRSERHIAQNIAATASRIAKGTNEKIAIGDINIIREWGYAGDIVKGIWKLVQQDEITEAVIGTGKGFSIKDWLEECFELIDKDWTDYVEPAQDFVADYKELVSDPSTIFSLGWKPEVDLAGLAAMMVKK